MNTVLLMELGKVNRLLGVLQSTSDDVQRAVKGLVVFSPDLEAVAQGFLLNVLPSPWMGVSYPSLKPTASYVDDFIARYEFFKHWVSGADGDAPDIFWFSSFFFQQALMTGAMQNYARADQIAIDRCLWTFEVLPDGADTTNGPPPKGRSRGTYVNGLFLDGARWDSGTMTLQDSYPKVLWDTMATIWMNPVEIDSTGHKAYLKLHLYECPVYKNSDRKGVLSTSGHSSNFILWLAIPISTEHTAEYVFHTKTVFLCFSTFCIKIKI